jgi:hypothetical protein
MNNLLVQSDVHASQKGRLGANWMKAEELLDEAITSSQELLDVYAGKSL